MRKLFFLLTVCFLGAGISGCGSSDLSLLNEVKRFEPEWMDLSEQVISLNNLLRRAEATSESFADHAMSRLRTANRGSELTKRFQSLTDERNKISSQFEEKRETFETTVYKFNEWQNDLMQDKLKEKKATETFKSYQETYLEIQKGVEETEKEVIKNVEAYNRLVREIADVIKSQKGEEYLVDPDTR